MNPARLIVTAEGGVIDATIARGTREIFVRCSDPNMKILAMTVEVYKVYYTMYMPAVPESGRIVIDEMLNNGEGPVSLSLHAFFSNSSEDFVQFEIVN